MMQIFVKKPQGETTTLNVESNETISTTKRKLKEEEGIHSDMHLLLIFNGRLVEDGHTLAHYGITKSKKFTLHLVLSQDAIAIEPCTLFIKPWSRDVFILKVKRDESIDDVKAKIQEEKSIPSHKQLLFYRGKWLEDGSRTLAHYYFSNPITLDLAIQLEQGPQTKRARPASPTKATSIFDGEMQIVVKNLQGETTTLNVEKNERVCIIKSKLKEKEGIRSDVHLVLMYNGKLLDDGHTFSHYGFSKLKQYTLRFFLSQDENANEPYTLFVKPWSQNVFILKVKREDTIDDVKAKIQEEKGIPSHKQLLFHCGKLLEDGRRTLADCYISNPCCLDLAIQFEPEAQRQTKRARSVTPTKATFIEATAALMPESQACPPSSVLEGVKCEMATACNREKELEATISRLEAQNKKNEQELTIARDKEKELETTICGLRHKNKVFSDQCASYESLVDDMEVENKKTKEELMNADKKYYAGARAAGYAEGLKEGKAKRQKSLEFLHHLTDTSMRYFNHGFDSCLKQAEHQGFFGRLNKDSALKDAPDLKGWESSDEPH